MKTIPLWTAIITPLDANGNIDFHALATLLQQQEKFHNGVILLGSTGEGLNLNRVEKESILKFACSLKLKIPYLSGLPGHQLDEALDFMRFAQTCGVSGFLAVTPYYAKPGIQGQIHWFKRILDSTELPVMLYNVPSRAGTRLAPQTLTALKDHPNLWALKESSGSMESFLEYQSACPKLRFFCGDDGLMPEFAKAGATGLISVASNVWPEATRKVVEWSLAGKADDFQAMWQDCVDTLFLASNPVPTKWLHHHLGQIPTANLKPPLSMSDFKNQNEVLSAHKKIEQWLQERKAL